MRNALVVVLALITPVLAASIDSYARLKALFPQPPAEYSTLPFMVWNGEMTEAEIDRILDDYTAQGIHGFYIHPRPGMITPYLTGRWFQLIRYTVDQAKRRGMVAWLYDENSYPSGFAGGNVPAQMPESYNQGQGLVRRETGPCRILLRPASSGFEDVTGKAEPGPGDWCFGIEQYPPRAWNGGYPYVDLLLPGVTQKFIEVTMRGYEKTLGADFGRTVPGIFTDEPNINPPGRGAVKYTPDIFEQFQKRWGYDLKTSLPSLFEETGDWKRIRHNYYSTLLDLFIDRWSKPWHDYAEQKKVAWTGHYWEHGWPNPIHGPDNMAMYAWHQVPGIDMLFNQFDEGVNAQFGNVRSVKELASVASQMGRRRTLSETYGGAGWELRFEDMKRLGDWQAALGVNMMNQHLSFQTLLGARKYDYPQSFTYHEPWWSQYHVLANYFARLSLALSAGEQVNSILILEPTTSAWLYAGSRPNARMMEIGKEFQAYITDLEHRQVEYDLASENILKNNARVSGKSLVVGRRAYSTLVLPPGTENLDQATASLLDQYRGAGGTLISLGAESLAVDGKPGAFRAPRTVAAPLTNPLFQKLDGGMLFHQRRRLPEGELWFFANSSLETPARASIAAPGHSIEVMDLLTGSTRPFPAKASGSNVDFTVDLPPAGSLLLMVRNSAGVTPDPTPERKAEPVAAVSTLAIARTSPNAMRLDYCDLTINGQTERGLYFYVAQDKAFKAHGFAEGNPWNTAVQYQTSILDRNHFPPDAGFSATFWFDTDASLNPAGLKAVVERPALWKMAVNGVPVENTKGEWWLDKGFGVYAIGAHVKPGRNSITITTNPMSVHSELEPVYLVGDFAAIPQQHGFALAAPSPVRLGAWKEQGLPFYSQAVSYSARYTLRQGGAYKVSLGRWAGTVAEVRVNGKSAGIIGWQPYELEIGPLVRNGENTVEVVVYGSLKNLLGPHHGKINRGLTGPGSFRSAPASQPPGESYDQLPYGLMEAFQVSALR